MTAGSVTGSFVTAGSVAGSFDSCVTSSVTVISLQSKTADFLKINYIRRSFVWLSDILEGK